MIPKRPTLYALPVIGWREDVFIPLLASTLIAKIDTGARTAALHAEDIEILRDTVKFKVSDTRFQLPCLGSKKIKSSNGHVEHRAVIAIEIAIGLHKFLAEFTLTDRADMGVPVLLGRNTIKGRFLVNPARSFILSRKKKPK